MELDNKLFLETTIQIIRFSGRQAEQNKIYDIISKFDYITTSTYVKMEYKRRLIGDLVYFYNIIASSDSMPEIFFKIERLHNLQIRRIKGYIGSFGNFLKKVEEDDPEIKEKEILEKARHYFKYMPQIAWEAFDKNLSGIVNETNCPNSINGPIFEGKLIRNQLSCKKAEKKCGIIGFIIKNKGDIEKILKRFSCTDKLDDEQKKMRNTIEKALLYPQNMAHYDNCWQCGDLIIALECPKNAYLFTTNIKHYSPICDELGKKILDNQDESNSPPEESHS